MSVVVVGWILVLLAAFGLNHTHDVLVEARTVRHEVERHRLRAWARSGVELARHHLETGDTGPGGGLVYPGPDNPLAGVHACGEGRFVVGNDVYEARWQPGLGDLGSRLPAALADSTALEALPGMTRGGIARILRARAVAGDRILPPFEYLGLDDASLDAARRYLSRYGGTVNANTASLEVLCAVGLPRSAAEKLLRRRVGRDGLPWTADDRPLPDLDNGHADLRDCGLNAEEAAVLAYIVGAGRLTVESQHYGVSARGWAAGHEGICEIRAVLAAVPGGAVRIVEWTEDWLE